MGKIAVRTTPKSKESLMKIKGYILQHHTQKEYRSLLKKIKETVNLLEKGNVSFMYSPSKDIYKVLVHKYCTMYYRKVNEEMIHIILFRDNRMDHRKNPFDESL